jgi:hypothetical protein
VGVVVTFFILVLYFTNAHTYLDQQDRYYFREIKDCQTVGEILVKTEPDDFGESIRSYNCLPVNGFRRLKRPVHTRRTLP